MEGVTGDIIETLEGLHDLEPAYKLFLENSRDAVIVWKAKGAQVGKVVLVNESAATLHGYRVDEMLALNMRDIESTDDGSWIPDRISRFLQGKKISSEVNHRKKDGTIIPLEVAFRTFFKDGMYSILCIDKDASKRRASEQDMSDREKLLESITIASPDIIYVYDLEEQRSVYTNRHMEDVLGFSPDELGAMEGNFLKKLVHPDDLQKLPQTSTKWLTAQDDELIDTDYRLRNRAGEWRWFVGRDAVFKRNRSGKVKQIIGTARDKTDRINAELSNQQTVSVLNATLESTLDGILVVSRERKIAAYNSNFLQLWSIPRELAELKDDEQLLKYVLAQLVDPEGFLKKVYELYEDWSAESNDELVFKDGRIFGRYSKPQMIGNEIVGRVWSFRNITDQRKKEISLRESEERFKRLMEASFGGIAIYDQGRIIDANHGLAQITGYDVKELIGLDGLHLIAPEYREHAVQKMRAALELPYDVIGIKKDGTRYHLEIHGKNIPYQNRIVQVTEFRDITNRKQIEDSVREQNVSLLSTAENLTKKNSQLEEFTQIVSHNLRSPAGNIVTLLGLLQNAKGDEQQEY